MEWLFGVACNQVHGEPPQLRTGRTAAQYTDHYILICIEHATQYYCILVACAIEIHFVQSKWTFTMRDKLFSPSSSLCKWLTAHLSHFLYLLHCLGGIIIHGGFQWREYSTNNNNDSERHYWPTLLLAAKENLKSHNISKRALRRAISAHRGHSPGRSSSFFNIWRQFVL